MNSASDCNPSLWVVSELYHPEDTSTGHFLTGIAEGLAADHRVQVLCNQPSYAARGRKDPARERLNGVEIHRSRGTAFNRGILPLRLINVLSVSLAIGLAALRKFRRGDRVLVVTTPPLLPCLILLACRVRGAQCTVLVHDLYPDALLVAGLVREGSLVERLLDRTARWLYQGSHHVVAIGRDMRDRLLRRVNDPSLDISVIPNWADIETVRPIPAAWNQTLRRFPELQGHTVFQYCGNMGLLHNVDILVEAARILQHDQSVRFLLVGAGSRKEHIRRICHEEQLPNVTVSDRVPREELPELLNVGDVALVTLSPGMSGVSVPSRLYNILAAGKPVLAVADADSELARVVLEEQAGLVVPPTDAAALARAVVELASAPDLRRAMGKRARQVAEQKYSRRQVIDAFRSLFGETAAEKTPQQPASEPEAEPRPQAESRLAAGSSTFDEAHRAA